VLLSLLPWSLWYSTRRTAHTRRPKNVPGTKKPRFR
jgi:hypothetical protein